MAGKLSSKEIKDIVADIIDSTPELKKLPAKDIKAYLDKAKIKYDDADFKAIQTELTDFYGVDTNESKGRHLTKTYVLENVSESIRTMVVNEAIDTAVVPTHVCIVDLKDGIEAKPLIPANAECYVTGTPEEDNLVVEDIKSGIICDVTPQEFEIHFKALDSTSESTNTPPGTHLLTIQLTDDDSVELEDRFVVDANGEVFDAILDTAVGSINLQNKLRFYPRIKSKAGETVENPLYGMYKDRVDPKALDEAYYGDGTPITKLSDLKKGQKYEWTPGAEELDVTFIGQADEHPDKKAATSMGKGLLFQFDDGSYVEVSFRAIREQQVVVIKALNEAAETEEEKRERLILTEKKLFDSIFNMRPKERKQLLVEIMELTDSKDGAKQAAKVLVAKPEKYKKAIQLLLPSVHKSVYEESDGIKFPMICECDENGELMVNACYEAMKSGKKLRAIKINKEFEDDNLPCINATAIVGGKKYKFSDWHLERKMLKKYHQAEGGDKGALQGVKNRLLRIGNEFIKEHKVLQKQIEEAKKSEADKAIKDKATELVFALIEEYDALTATPEDEKKNKKRVKEIEKELKKLNKEHGIAIDAINESADDKIKIVVVDEEALCYIDPETPNVAQTLSVRKSIVYRNWENIYIKGKKVRPATLKDFDYFGVEPNGYVKDENYEFDRSPINESADDEQLSLENSEPEYEVIVDAEGPLKLKTVNKVAQQLGIQGSPDTGFIVATKVLLRRFINTLKGFDLIVTKILDAHNEEVSLTSITPYKQPGRPTNKYNYPNRMLEGLGGIAWRPVLNKDHFSHVSEDSVVDDQSSSTHKFVWDPDAAVLSITSINGNHPTQVDVIEVDELKLAEQIIELVKDKSWDETKEILGGSYQYDVITEAHHIDRAYVEKELKNFNVYDGEKNIDDLADSIMMHLGIKDDEKKASLVDHLDASYDEPSGKVVTNMDEIGDILGLYAIEEAVDQEQVELQTKLKDVCFQYHNQQIDQAEANTQIQELIKDSEPLKDAFKDILPEAIVDAVIDHFGWTESSLSEAINPGSSTLEADLKKLVSGAPSEEEAEAIGAQMRKLIMDTQDDYTLCKLTDRTRVNSELVQYVIEYYGWDDIYEAADPVVDNVDAELKAVCTEFYQNALPNAEAIAKSRAILDNCDPEMHNELIDKCANCEDEMLIYNIIQHYGWNAFELADSIKE